MNDLIFIIARNGSAARASAINLALSPSPGRTWWWVEDEHCLRGRRKVKVHYGCRWDEHPRIEAILANMDRLGDAVEVVESPRDIPGVDPFAPDSYLDAR